MWTAISKPGTTSILKINTYHDSYLVNTVNNILVNTVNNILSSNNKTDEWNCLFVETETKKWNILSQQSPNFKVTELENEYKSKDF